ncbi:MAG: hypothetical protein K2G47_00970 [Muribaculum sp.]|nr:hypothetical protein [Muribaculum sp.]
MKKYLLALALMVPMLTGCSSAQGNAKKEIEKRLEVATREGAAYSIDDCIYSADNDSCFIFSGDFSFPDEPKFRTEYLYRQTQSGLLIAIKNLDLGGSLLRNMNNKANSGNETIDNVLNEAFKESGLGLSVTIYNDLQNGSLVDITNATLNK